MKRLLIFAIILLDINCIMAQSVKSIPVPKAKESLQIDTLLNEVIKSAIPNKSCVLIETHKKNQQYLLDISLLKTDDVAYDLGGKNRHDNYSFNYLNDLRFLKYKGYIVFIAGEKDPYGFFIKKKESKVFTFVSSFNKKDKDPLNRNVFYKDFFKYENGRFVSLFVNVE